MPGNYEYIWCQFYQQLTSTFFAQIPKAQKDLDDLTAFLRFWDLHKLKHCVNMLVKSNLGDLENIN